ncbi:hypothetical protein Tco_0671583, partial [Tanacetum coccineum]
RMASEDEVASTVPVFGSLPIPLNDHVGILPPPVSIPNIVTVNPTRRSPHQSATARISPPRIMSPHAAEFVPIDSVASPVDSVESPSVSTQEIVAEKEEKNEANVETVGQTQSDQREEKTTGNLKESVETIAKNEEEETIKRWGDYSDGEPEIVEAAS